MRQVIRRLSDDALDGKTASTGGERPLKGAKLGWQSRLLVAAVGPAAGLWAMTRIARRGAASAKRIAAISLASGAGVWAARAATPQAALTGTVLASAMLIGTSAGPSNPEFRGKRNPSSASWIRTPLPPLLTLILLTTAATRYKREKKRKPERSGRNAAQITANLGIAALTACVPPRIATHVRKMAILVSALSEATADTLSSELGEVLGGKPYLITSGRQAPAGTDGAVSLIGSLAGTAGAGAVVLSALPALCDSGCAQEKAARAAAAAAAGAVAGLFFDSLLGATAEQRGWINNDAVNFLSTFAAAATTALLSR